MWVSDKWEDYELIDCSDGEKLERWGEHVLVRPDPQAIWSTPRRDKRWESPDARYHRVSGGGGQWNTRKLPEQWSVRYGELAFHVKPTNFKHTGLFPEQAVNWEYIMRSVREANEILHHRVSVLNLFAYTGGATMAAAYAGAEVCHVDAAKGMVGWARENAKACNLEDKPIRWIVDDCTGFIERELRRGHQYDAIIMDPPSYGRGPSGEVWKLEKDLYAFVKLAVSLLSDHARFVLINSYTTGLSPSVLGYIMGSLLTPKFGGRVVCDELGLPVTKSGLNLPCGAAGRWNAEK